MSSQKKPKNQRIKRNKNSEKSSYVRGYDELLDGRFAVLRRLPSYVGYRQDLGKEIYSYSDSRTWIDLSPKQKLQARFSAQGIFLCCLAALLTLWLIFSFIYRMVTEENKGGVALSMLPSLLIVSACVAILLISVFGGWGKLLRWGYKRNLVRGRDAISRRQHKAMREEIKRADLNKQIESAVSVYQNFVSLSIHGQIYNFLREAVSVKVANIGSLWLTFNIDGYEFEFVIGIPTNQFVQLNKAFNGRLQTVKEEKQKYDPKKLLKEIPALAVAVVIVTVSIMLIIAHYLWIPSLPSVVGVFFLCMCPLVFCNIFSDIQIVNELGTPFAFSIALLIAPPWAYVWIETELMHNSISFLYILTHCSVYAAGFGFFWVMGFYALSFAISRAVDYVRYGKV